MESKNRLAITAAVILLIVFALATSFGRNLFLLNTPSVVLPDENTSGSGTGNAGDSGSGFHLVKITPDTVQSVIATLSRPDSYYRELTASSFWGEDSSSTIHIQVWVDGEWSHSKQLLPSGAVRHDLTGDGTLYYWYDGSRAYLTAPAGDGSADLAQRIPTYETVLELSPDSIISAGYEMLDDAIPCIKTEVMLSGPTRVERYWVSVDNGLLVRMEMEQDGALVYLVTAGSEPQSPCPAGNHFLLPNGERPDSRLP